MYKRLRYMVRFSRVLIAKYYIVIIIGLVLGVASFLVVPKLLTQIPALQPQQKIALVGRPTMGDLPIEVLEHISIGLTTLDMTGYPGPGIAESWEVTDAGKTYIFTLRNNLHWQDGTPVKSSDLDLKFRDASVEYPDNSHIVIKLPNPYSPLPVVVSRPITKKGTKNVVGIGSYRTGSVKRNGSYVESLNLEPVDKKLPRIKYFFYSSPGQAETAFKLGLVNQISDLPDASEFRDWPNVNITSTSQTDRYVAVFFNLDNPNLSGQSGKNLRLALAYAIDKSIYPTDRRAVGPISPESWAYNPEIKTYDYDVPRAKQLLEKVEKIPDKIILNSIPTYAQVGEKVKAEWEKLGLNVDLQIAPETPDDFEAFIIAQAVPADPDQYNLWHSTQKGTSLTNLNNPRIDKLLEDGRQTLEKANRRDLYYDFQKFLVEEMPAVFLYYPQSYTISRK